MPVKFNPLSNNFDFVNKTSIPEYENADKTSAIAGDVWVKRTVALDGDTGVPRGLLLALTYTGDGISTYQLSYRTVENTTIRVDLT